MIRFLSGIYKLKDQIAYRDRYVGLFGHVENQQFFWSYCRDQIQRISTPYLEKGIIFIHCQNKSRDIADFIRFFEKKLKIPFSQFQRTDASYGLYIIPSPFWLSSLMRRSFFTLLLRASLNFDRNKKNYKKTLYACNYAANTKPAIERFLRGFTHYETPAKQYHYAYEPTLNNKYGWNFIFQNMPLEKVRNFLKKPT